MSSVSIIGKNLGQVEEDLSYDSIEDLAAIVSTQSWSPSLFSQHKRVVANFTRTELLVLDVDSGCSLSEALDKFKDYKHVICTSKSHQVEKNGVVCDRFRVVLFLEGAILNDADFKATWQTAQNRWKFIDSACKDSSRFFYPSPGIISINRDGHTYPISIALTDSRQHNKVDGESKQSSGANEGIRGELWKSTYKLLAQGAPAGFRHTELIKAVGNMREQGYDLAETLEALETMASSELADWTQPYLSEVDKRTVERMFNREMKYPGLAPENKPNWTPIIVNASELLDETFAYLADKDRVKGEPTGINGLDRLLGGGFRTGELTVLMAQAKTGKNTLYHQMIYKYLERGIPFGYASRELSPATEVLPNFLSLCNRSNAWKQDISESYRENARKVVASWPLHFAPGYGYMSSQDIETWFKTCVDLGVKHFLFDHFHYSIEDEDHNTVSRQIRLLKTLTKELDIHLSLIVQPRSLREGETLSLATLRGGATIGQALDNLLILEREKSEKNISRLSLEVARHKLATLGHIFLQYNPETTEFIEVEKSTVINTPMPQGIDRSYKKPWPRVEN